MERPETRGAKARKTPVPVAEQDKVSVRMTGEDRHLLHKWAGQQAALHPPLRGRLFHINGAPKISAIIRYAALEKAKEAR